ncbi:MAG: helix-turn-helix domain-containing protein [Clostridia bacterium]|nr:helix-turn-helix domain-containing protein [Clostridia bacterium]
MKAPEKSGAFTYIMMKRKKDEFKGLTVLTGAQFRQYVHISTRKLKYLMDNDIVPHNNTGQATHKYEIKKTDADAFLHKIKTDPEFMAESKGIFTSRYNHPRRTIVIDDAFKEYAIGYFEELWAEQPVAMTAQIAAELIGSNRQYIRRLYEDKEIPAIIIKRSITFSKSDFIAFICRKDRLIHPPTMKLRGLIEEIKETYI